MKKEGKKMQLEKNKIYRIIELYQRFNNGEVMSKKKYLMSMEWI